MHVVVYMSNAGGACWCTHDCVRTVRGGARQPHPLLQPKPGAPTKDVFLPSSPLDNYSHLLLPFLFPLMQTCLTKECDGSKPSGKVKPSRKRKTKEIATDVDFAGALRMLHTKVEELNLPCIIFATSEVQPPKRRPHANSGAVETHPSNKQFNMKVEPVTGSDQHVATSWFTNGKFSKFIQLTSKTNLSEVWRAFNISMAKTKDPIMQLIAQCGLNPNFHEIIKKENISYAQLQDIVNNPEYKRLLMDRGVPLGDIQRLESYYKQKAADEPATGEGDGAGVAASQASPPTSNEDAEENNT
mmetsp:Transcript_3336/g.6931  ORF Transcript_3336/g.6931 Transcript_3336/m.6931 type:complete len:300 (-) Transcript_3336:16-915(-)